MTTSKQERLYGWGHCPAAECISYRPEKRRGLQALPAQHAAPLIARGLGRSYGDAALQPQGVIRTERLDHVIDFDAQTGVIRAQAGVTLAQIMEAFIPKGWLPPVLPGTRHVTLGGALACNIHGKNQFRMGDFAEHVISFTLLMANGEIVECDPQSQPELFWATAGGMGMTGIIDSVTLQLMPISSSSLRTLTYRVDSPDDMIAAFEHYRDGSDYMVGWIDHMASEEKMGRGIFESASHISPAQGGAALAATVKRPGLNVPFFMPPFLLNRYSMAAYNAYRFKKYSSERVSEMANFDSFFHPLDRVANWNRLYGRRGFYQYQCLLPETPDIAARLQELLTLLRRQQALSFLAVLKYHRASPGYLAFSQQGYSLALDFPNTPRVRALLPYLNQWIAERGGRVYLAKDASLSAEHFRTMYGEDAGQWLAVLRDFDTRSRFRSLMSDRLQWKPAA